MNSWSTISKRVREVAEIATVVFSVFAGVIVFSGGAIPPWTTAAQGQALEMSDLEQNLRLNEMERDKLYPLIWDMEDRGRSGFLSDEDRLQLQFLRDRLRALNAAIEAQQAAVRESGP